MIFGCRVAGAKVLEMTASEGKVRDRPTTTKARRGSQSGEPIVGSIEGGKNVE
jgi:hypothetical protein